MTRRKLELLFASVFLGERPCKNQAELECPSANFAQNIVWYWMYFAKMSQLGEGSYDLFIIQKVLHCTTLQRCKYSYTLFFYTLRTLSLSLSLNQYIYIYTTIYLHHSMVFCKKPIITSCTATTLPLNEGSFWLNRAQRCCKKCSVNFTLLDIPLRKKQ